MSTLNVQPTFEILLNPSVKEVDELRLSKQCKKIIKLLNRGTITTSQLSSIARQYSARVNEIRHAIVKQGLMIDMEEGVGGENFYRLVLLEDSKFWKRVVQRGQQWRWT